MGNVCRASVSRGIVCRGYILEEVSGRATVRIPYLRCQYTFLRLDIDLARYLKFFACKHCMTSKFRFAGSEKVFWQSAQYFAFSNDQLLHYSIFTQTANLSSGLSGSIDNSKD